MLLDRLGISNEELSARVGVKNATGKNRARPVPRVWYGKLGLDEPGTLDEEAGAPIGRDEERPPQAPPGARRIKQPEPPSAEQLMLAQGIDYSEVEGLISAAYKGAAAVVAERDPPLSSMIESHADEAARAWAEWIRSNPKAAAFLERMMVGTPFGKVISVHLGIGVGYYFARREYVAELRRQAAEAEVEGAAVP